MKHPKSEITKKLKLETSNVCKINYPGGWIKPLDNSIREKTGRSQLFLAVQ